GRVGPRALRGGARHAGDGRGAPARPAHAGGGAAADAGGRRPRRRTGPRPGRRGVSDVVLSTEQLGQVKNPFAYAIQRFQRRPLEVVKEVLAAEPDPWQRRALSALQKGHRRLSIRSGHGVGKTTLLSWV